MSKSNPATLGPTISDFLKWDASRLTRTTVPAAIGTKAGALVEFPLREMPLVALTDESDGQVVVQPHSCIIDLSLVSEAAISTALGGTEELPKTVEDLAKQGDAFGIIYQGTPLA
ncbi:oxaloacetate decarboxylase alpha chain [Vitreoscilla massiliensis]|uniref:Oxaloacetate decarboxylase alpha chain n=1 Tax=Vitreoscilla massiliensis TaxID=1689272 RepID=A0ABY4E241_9NEIS|nr:hypothetical protein [Vitreoscilla massiliensis]UOO89597.1 oxaloacetate decarboxylase alpha chain [Vitreoscilla massiliensis]